MNRNDGKTAEAAVQKCLVWLETKYPCTFNRLYDSRSARNLIPPNPADFIVGFDGKFYLLEVKSSIKFDTLKRAGVNGTFSANQLLSCRLWTRAGLNYIAVFYGAKKQFEIHYLHTLIEDPKLEPVYRGASIEDGLLTLFLGGSK